MKTTTLVDEAGVVGTAGPSTKKFFPITLGGNISLQLATTGTLRCSAPKVYGSNLSGADVNGDANASDISAAFTLPGSSTGIADVTSDGSSQGVQAGPLWFAYIAVQFPAPTAGAGRLFAAMNDAGRT
jgi:hypothetical protein